MSLSTRYQSLTPGDAAVRFLMRTWAINGVAPEGILWGGARVLGDLTSGSSYPPFLASVADDAGQFWPCGDEVDTPIEWVDTSGACTLYLIPFGSTDDYPTGTRIGNFSIVAQLTISTPPSDSLPLGSGSVVASAFTSFTPASAFISNGPLDTLYGTGLLTGGILSINADTTKFDIADGSGYVVDNHTDPESPVKVRVEWSGLTGISATHIASADSTNIAIDATGAVVQQVAPFTLTQVRDYIVLGRIGHNTHAAITTVSTLPRVVFNTALDADDLAEALGALNISGNVYGPHGADLYVNKSEGDIYRTGANYTASKKCPNVLTSAAMVSATLYYSYANGSGGWTVASSATADPSHYDDGTGVLASVPNNKYTIQRIFLVASAVLNVTAVQYGQYVYASLADAQAAIATESVATNPNLDDALLRGWLIVKEGATDLSDSTHAMFMAAGKLGEPLHFGAGGVGDVVGPGSATDSDFAQFDGVTGKLLKDGGYGPSSFIAAPGGAAQGDVLYHNGSAWVILSAGTAGKLLKTLGPGANPIWSLITEDELSLSDVTTANVSTLRHGLTPKLSGDSSQFLNGAGNFATPTGVVNSYSSTSFTTQTSVNVVHNFGTKPLVQVLNTSGVEVVPQEVTHNTANDFTVTFSVSRSGTIIATVGSPQPAALTVATGNYSVLITDNIVKCTGAASTITLPTAIGNTGHVFSIKNASAGDISVTTSLSQTIDNIVTQVLPSGSSMSVFSDGSNWWID